MIVLILVAVLWIAVLVPSVISKLSERRSAGSIDHFHERLDLLERTGPKLVAPAYRLTGTQSPANPTGAVAVAAAPPPPAAQTSFWYRRSTTPLTLRRRCSRTRCNPRRRTRSWCVCIRGPKTRTSRTSRNCGRPKSASLWRPIAVG